MRRRSPLPHDLEAISAFMAFAHFWKNQDDEVRAATKAFFHLIETDHVTAGSLEIDEAGSMVLSLKAHRRPTAT